MATTKKTKRKAKTKRKTVAKARARKKTTRIRQKPAKKTPVRRVRPKKAQPTAPLRAKPKPAAPSAPPAAAAPPLTRPTQPALPEERIGMVTHYYSHLSVATLRLESGTLRVGDVIHIRGHTTDFNQRVESLEVNHAPVTEVGPSDDFGLKVVEHTREHDVVYKVRQ
jgi:hypothetical protein